jgi:glutamate-1-semialdehyde 2,1-aminomutase
MTTLWLHDIDRQIWEEELAEFVPQEIFDAHSHIYPEIKSTAKGTGEEPFPVSTMEILDHIDSLFLPGRKVHRIAFGNPVVPGSHEEINAFVAKEVQADPESAALMLVRPDVSPESIDHQIQAYGFVGFKPYRIFSSTGDVVECRIPDFMPENQLEVANRYGLMITLHLSKSKSIADPDNLSDLEYLTNKYPRIKWILAHCARSYYDRPLLRAKDRLCRIPNLWYDISSVCDTDAMAILLEIAGVERVMYGSDDLPVGVTRGKYITFAYAWAELNDKNHMLGLSHCQPDMTVVRYESLRAFSRACRRFGFGAAEREKLFYANAKNLIELVRSAK